jgi:hypothetical protein
MPPKLEFEFVVQSQDVYKDGFTKETRTRIRKQAMKKVGVERRKLGDYGKHNMRQCPVIVDEIIYNATPMVAEVSRPNESTKQAKTKTPSTVLYQQTVPSSSSNTRPRHAGISTALCIAAPMPLSGLDRLVADYGINPVHFSSLTNVHLGGVAAAVLSSEPQRLQGLLAGRSWSYFMFVPSRFGHYPFLDDALRCLIAKVRAMMAPSDTNEKMIFSYYGKALTSLQKAVQDPKNCSSPDVLGATGILSVFEVSKFR